MACKAVVAVKIPALKLIALEIFRLPAQLTPQ